MGYYEDNKLFEDLGRIKEIEITFERGMVKIDWNGNVKVFRD